MRVHYDRRGRVRGYSTGIGGYMVGQWLSVAGALLVIGALLIAVAAVIAVVLMIAAIAAVVVAGRAVSGRRRKRQIAAREQVAHRELVASRPWSSPALADKPAGLEEKDLLAWLAIGPRTRERLLAAGFSEATLRQATDDGMACFPRGLYSLTLRGQAELRGSMLQSADGET
jgi:hypothetical protein